MASKNSNVIDLTSDDEDISLLQPVADRINFLPPVNMPSQTLTFNGLPDPNEFSRRTSTQGRGRDAVTRTVYKHGKPILVPGQSPLAHPTPHLSNTNKRTLQPAIKPSAAYRDENTGVGPSGSRSTNAMEAASKRRKLENGTPGGRISSGPILPPSRPQTLSAGSRTSSGIQVVVPASTSKPSGIVSTSRAPGNISRILPNPPNYTMPAATHTPMSPGLRRLLDHQVLPHVHAAVRPYRDTLTHEERKEIGQNAASRLVTGTGFMAHYLKNNKTITSAFEHQIKLNAYTFVNQGVEKIVQKRLQEEEEEEPSSSMQYGTTALAYNGLKSSVETSENDSSPPSEEIEHSGLEKKRRRAQSISTSTSYSNGYTDAETGKRTASVDENHDSGSDVSRSRRAAANLPQGAYQVKKRVRRSAAEMEEDRRKAIRSEMQAKNGSFSRNAVQLSSSPAPRPATSARIQEIQADKPKRRRRTKAQMEEARRLEGRGSGPAGANPYSRFANESSPSGSYQSPALARGNVARPYMQPPVAQPIRNSGNADLPLDDDPLDDDPLKRPYISSVNRKKLKAYLSNPAVVKQLSKQVLDMIKPDTLHVQFSTEEMTLLLQVLAAQGGRGPRKLSDGNPLAQIVKIMKDPGIIPKVVKALQSSKRSQEKTALLRTRDIEAITDFLKDASTSAANAPFKLRVAPPPHVGLMALLRDREINGMSPVRSRQGRSAMAVVANSHLEDALVRQSEWTDCSGDISSITWTSPTSFICGALAHSDSHNMQYNKPGNLLVGSTSLDRVKSLPDHRVIRPVVANEGDKENANALDSMRTTQSPWLYESVVSTTYCEVSQLSFTASFDKTVKAWSNSEAGSDLTLQGTWQHHEKVNFVTASPHHDRVATACAANGYAVRVYKIDTEDVSRSPYQEYCGERSNEGANELGKHDKWSYQPATMQWGKSLGVRDFLLVGYSPRSIAGNDSDVPELKRNTGELCLWNTSSTDPVFVLAAKSHNVFEVIWHPTQPIFLAATSPHGSFDSYKTKTQVRIYHQQESGTFVNVKNLDCPAIDINELTIKANSTVECYVTASCTDGFTYVWDTARSDRPIHALQHGETVDNPDPDVPLDVGDSGVKFAAWGMSSDRFYTGGSDGVIKAWNIKASRGNVFVRNIMTISGGISTGVFNADCSKLLIGDATGKIYFLSIDDSDIKEDTEPAGPANAHTLAFGSQLSRAIRRPKLVVPHPEPLPPPGYIVQAAEMTGVEAAQELLTSGQIVRIPEYHNFAFQGPNYMQTNFFRREAHVHFEPSQPLIDEIWASQRVNMDNTLVLPFHPRLPNVIASSSAAQHLKNIQQDNANFSKKTLFEWDKSKISSELWALLDNGKLLDLAQEVTYDFPYEITTRFEMFEEWKKHLLPKGLPVPTPRAGSGFVEEEEVDDDVMSLSKDFP
ncbi:hypothetical protein VTL71DRAFT_2658 [Oculimacula yallundae]|uniref:Uncharacterized protein n=1 Tax=Oculimacula yallundae TaxID=86028 RepID=A0ABR4CAN6_9HELO